MSNQILPSIAILGAGPAGLAGALRVAKNGKAQVTLFDAAPQVGGNAGSFELDGVHCDYGSHRLHPVADPVVLADLQEILGEDLRLRPRHGRIRLNGSWIHFPLKPFDLLTKLRPTFSLKLLFDGVTAKLRAKNRGEETFESILLRGLGKTMCHSFYFPYVQKLWGLTPSELAPMLAHRRVSGSSIFKLLAKILRSLPLFRSATTGRFYYPKHGFGQICERFAEAALVNGARIELSSSIIGLKITDNRAVGVEVVRPDGTSNFHSADGVWTTLPITLLVRLAGTAAPANVQHAAKCIKFRGMILIYLVLETNQFSEFDAHYFPEASVPISRLSEPKNYSAADNPLGVTVLCAELPADAGDDYWERSDEELGDRLCEWLEECGLPVIAPVRRSVARRLTHAYPVYDREFAQHFETMDAWVESVQGLHNYGRQGLFAHDNTHHAFAMAYASEECLRADGSFDEELWSAYRTEFESHVVED